MARRPNAEDSFNIKVLNDKELQELFKDLKPAVQNRVVLGGMKKAAQVILTQAKSNFKSKQKNKSKTGYKNFSKSFTTVPMTKSFGLRVGVKNYKYKWIEWGAGGEDNRYWKRKTKTGTKKSTGKIEPTNFFYDAVEKKKTEAQDKVSQAIIESLNKTVARYNKKYS